MKVIIAESAGFCWGVKRAVEKARSVIREIRQSDPVATIYTDGPLIHNEEMIQQLLNEGIHPTDTPQSLSECALLIRAHGISPDRRTMLGKLPVTLIDATCPDVARIQGAIRKYARKNYHIIIFGDKGHAEVVGLLGYARKKGFVITQKEDVKDLPDMDPVCMVSQSTQFPSSYAEIIKAVKERFPRVEVLHTICKATENRQKEIVELARIADAIVVVGDLHSANTIRLVKLANTLKPTFHIQTGRELEKDLLKGFKVIGLTAGASTPEFIIENVRKILETI